MEIRRFFKKAVRMIFFGTKVYYLWCAFLLTVIGVAVSFYIEQLNTGLIATNMRDQVSWGLYIGNFTYLVGVAAAAVLLVIPAYIYHFEPIKEIVVIGELLAAAAIIMCLMFVTADLGRPDICTATMSPGDRFPPLKWLNWAPSIVNGSACASRSPVTCALGL